MKAGRARTGVGRRYWQDKSSRVKGDNVSKENISCVVSSDIKDSMFWHEGNHMDHQAAEGLPLPGSTVAASGEFSDSQHPQRDPVTTVTRAMASLVATTLTTPKAAILKLSRAAAASRGLPRPANHPQEVGVGITTNMRSAVPGQKVPIKSTVDTSLLENFGEKAEEEIMEEEDKECAPGSPTEGLKYVRWKGVATILKYDHKDSSESQKETEHQHSAHDIRQDALNFVDSTIEVNDAPPEQGHLECELEGRGLVYVWRARLLCMLGLVVGVLLGWLLAARFHNS